MKPEKLLEVGHGDIFKLNITPWNLRSPLALSLCWEIVLKGPFTLLLVSSQPGKLLSTLAVSSWKPPTADDLTNNLMNSFWVVW